MALLTGSVSKSIPPAAGQSARTNDPFEIRSEADYLPFERLSRYTRATFAAQLNSTFRLKREVGFVLMTLEEVRDAGYPTVTQADPASENFVLVFRGRRLSLPQDTYMLDHEALGTFPLFLVPGGSNRLGQESFIAVINRVGRIGVAR
jgi:hypothetical protein